MAFYEETWEFLNDQKYWQKQLLNAIDEYDLNEVRDLIKEGIASNYTFPNISKEIIMTLPEELGQKLS